MLEELHPKPSLATRLGVGDEETRAAPYLRAILAFAAEAPAVGWLVKGSKEALAELSDEADDQALERRFDELLAIGGQTNERVRLLADLARAMFEQNAVLLEFLHARQLPAAQEPLTQFAKEAALAAYRNRVANDFMYADHRGIEGVTRQAHVASLLLDDVYVLPRLVPEREQVPIHERERELLHGLLSDRDLAAARRVQLEEEFALLTGERWKLLARATAHDAPLGRALGESRRVVVIGSPGVGKSTLSRYLARTCALGAEEMEKRLEWRDDLVPVLIPLATFAEARRARPELGLRDFLDETMSQRGGEALRTTMADALEMGHVLVLLDGVDEVPESHARAALVQAVDEFISGHELARVVVTSRPYGYVRLRGDLPHYTLPNFSPEQVTEFVHRWQRACERKQHPQSPDMDIADEEAEALLAEIRRNARVEELATNPLMLVIVSLIRYERTRLPEERVQLYHRAVNTLMDTWNQWRSQLGRDAGGVMLPLDRLVRVWGAIAEWTRKERNTGVVHRAELKRKLVEVLRDREYADRDAEETAESYLRAAADRAGILEERGQDIFAFWHPTFEEFLAAVELATPTSQATLKLLPIADDPRWREVILLAVGYVGVVQRDPDTATEIVRAILEEHLPPEEPLLHRRLRLAAACIADDVGVRRSLKERVITKLAQIAATSPTSEMNDALVQTIRALPNLEPSPDTISALAPLASNVDWEVRMEATRLFSNVAAEDPEARSLCEKLMDDPDADVRSHAALGLARTGTSTNDVWRNLSGYSYLAQIEPAVAAFLQSVGPAVPSEIGKVIEQHGSAANFGLIRSFDPQHPGVLAEVKRLFNSENQSIRLEAAHLLHDWSADEAGVRDAVLGLLSSEHIRVRMEAAYRLREWGHEDTELRESVLELLSSEDLDVRLDAASLLSEWNIEGRAVKGTLLGLLGSDNTQIQFRSARLLRRWIVEDAEVYSAVIELLSSENRIVRLLTATVLHGSGVDEAAARDCLVSLVCSGDGFESFEAGKLLRAWGIDDAAARECLLNLLGSSNEFARLQAARTLREWGVEDAPVRETLRKLVDSDDHTIQVRAVKELLNWDIEDLVAREVARDIITSENPMRATAEESVASQGIPDLEVIERWARKATPEPWAALAACQQVLRGNTLTTAEVEALAELTARQDSDSEDQLQTRAHLRTWLWRRLEPIAERAHS